MEYPTSLLYFLGTQSSLIPFKRQLKTRLLKLIVIEMNADLRCTEICK